MIQEKSKGQHSPAKPGVHKALGLIPERKEEQKVERKGFDSVDLVAEPEVKAMQSGETGLS